jgi:Protein of unknown function (DUF1579)
MKRTAAAAGLIVIGLARYGLAQSPPPKPGPEHKAMGYFVGKWTGEADVKPGPMGPGGKMTSADTCEWFGDGFHVICRGEAKGPMGAMKTIGILSYGAADKAYKFYGLDSMGMAELSSGTKAGSTWTFSAESNIGGQIFKSRYSIVEVSPTSYTFKWEASADGTKWATLVEGKASKSGT